MSSRINEDDEGVCVVCEGFTTPGDFCYGCGSFICEDCNVNEYLPLGKHEWEDHIEDESGYSYDEDEEEEHLLEED